MASAQELTQNSKGPLLRTGPIAAALYQVENDPLGSRLRKLPSLMLVPSRFAGPEQRAWNRNYRCPEAFKRIDQWCARNGHLELVACLAHLHQQMRLASIDLASRGLSLRIRKSELLALVKSYHRHRSTRLRNRVDLLNRHLRYLADAGLALCGRGWARFLDVSEADVIRMQPYKKKRRFDGKIGYHWQNLHVDDGKLLKVLACRSGKPHRKTGHGGWVTQRRDGNGQFEARIIPRAQPVTSRPEAGSEVRQAERPPCLKTDLPPCNPVHPEAERSSAPPPTPNDSVAGGKTSADAVSSSVAHFLGRTAKFQTPEYRETSAAKQAEQDAYAARASATREAAAVRALLPPRELTPPRRPPPVATQPRPVVRRQQGVRVPPGASRTHELVRARVAVLTGLSVADATADPGAIERTPATRAQLLAAVPQLAWDRTLVGKLLRLRVSALSAWHAWAAAFGGGVPPGGNYVGRMLTNARHYQAWARGEPDGWCPYRALVRGQRARGSPRQT